MIITDNSDYMELAENNLLNILYKGTYPNQQPALKNLVKEYQRLCFRVAREEFARQIMKVF